MKKLVKKNLDELANIMPVITEDEQRQIMGSVMFYNDSGIFLGKLGTSDELRFVPGEMLFGDVLDKVAYAMPPGSEKDLLKRQEKAALSVGDSWSNTSEKARRLFVHTIANNESELSSLREVKFEESWVSVNKSAAVYRDKKTGEVTLGIAPNQMFFGTYTSALSTLVHEAHHARAGSGTTVEQNEDAAYSYQANNSTYANTSPAYKLELARGAFFNPSWRAGTSESLNERRRAASILFGVPENLIDSK